MERIRLVNTSKMVDADSYWQNKQFLSELIFCMFEARNQFLMIKTIENAF